MTNEIRDINLWESGKRKIDWVESNMPILRSIKAEFEQTKPFKGLKVALSVHLEAKTAYLCKTLAAGGAEMYITGSNPLSTQDDVAAALVHEGLSVFAWYDCTPEEYERHISKVIEAGPNIIIDDGGDLVTLIHSKYPELLPNVIGGCEETTTGIIRLLAMNREGKLKFPMALVNDADCKHLFDNRYGTGQSTWEALMHITNLQVSGKTVVVAGYGWCGRGVAMRAAGLGARVIVTEIDPVKAIEAVNDGHTVMTMDDAAAHGDFFITVTGCNDVVTERHFAKMKGGVILANAGHFDVEVDVKWLRENSLESVPRRESIMAHKQKDGRWLNVIAEGRLCNLAAGNGHPVEIMDMSFGVQALALEYMLTHGKGLAPGVYPVPYEIDARVSELKLLSMGMKVDVLTEAQKKYMEGL
jgi:adenosylhomocysteinase